jgi:hypothetical protein
MLDGVYREMVRNWEKPIVQRSEIKDFSFGLLNSPGYLANLDSKNLGPRKESFGSKVYYRKEDLAFWLQKRNQETSNPVVYKATDGRKIYTLEIFADVLFIGEDGSKLKKVKVKQEIEEMLESNDGIQELFERYCGRISFCYAADDGTYITSINAGGDIDDYE